MSRVRRKTLVLISLRKMGEEKCVFSIVWLGRLGMRAYM